MTNMLKSELKKPPYVSYKILTYVHPLKRTIEWLFFVTVCVLINYGSLLVFVVIW